MSPHVILEEERILECNWSVNGGFLEYDISHLHPNLSLLTQSYTVESIDQDGKLVYGSEFLVFKQGESTPSILKGYPKEVRVAIWQIAMAAKMKFFEEIQPDIVLHFIKQDFSFEKRYKIYSTYFRPPGYTIDKTKHEIIYTKEETNKTSTENGGGFVL